MADSNDSFVNDPANGAQAYLTQDRARYNELLDTLVEEVRQYRPNLAPERIPHLREFFAVVVGKGGVFTRAGMPSFALLAEMTPAELERAAEQIPDKLSPESRETFKEAAERRAPAAKWDQLFVDGSSEIVVPLNTVTVKSIDAQLQAVIDAHNAQAKLNAEAAAASGTLSNDINQRQIRRDPNDPAKLQVQNPKNGEWLPGQKLGGFLKDRNLWALEDDFSMENDRKGRASTQAGVEVADPFVLAQGERLAADQYNPDSLRVVISRDPQKIGEMSSGQHWISCMAEDNGQGGTGINFHYVPNDIEAGTLVAYVVSANDPDARYPLMRQLLKPFRNPKTGETILVPAKVYGADEAGNSFTRAALSETLNQFVRKHMGAALEGRFEMDSRLYGDGQDTTVNLSKHWTPEDINKALKRYHDSSLQEWNAEIEIRSHRISSKKAELRANELNLENATIIEKPQYEMDALLTEKASLEAEIAKAQRESDSLKKRINSLQNPDILARSFFREARKNNLGSLPEVADIIEAVKDPSLTVRHKAMTAAVMDDEFDAMKAYMETLPVQERVAEAAKVVDMNSWHESRELWRGAVNQVPDGAERVAYAWNAITNTDSLKKPAAEILVDNVAHVPDPLHQLQILDKAFTVGQNGAAAKVFLDVAQTVDFKTIPRIRDIHNPTNPFFQILDALYDADRRDKIRAMEMLVANIDTVQSADLQYEISKIILQNPLVGELNKANLETVQKHALDHLVARTYSWEDTNLFKQAGDHPNLKQLHDDYLVLQEKISHARTSEQLLGAIAQLPEPHQRVAALSRAAFSSGSDDDTIRKAAILDALSAEIPNIPSAYQQAEAYTLLRTQEPMSPQAENALEKTMQLLEDTGNSLLPAERIQFAQKISATLPYGNPYSERLGWVGLRNAEMRHLGYDDALEQSPILQKFGVLSSAEPGSELAEATLRSLTEDFAALPTNQQKVIARQLLDGMQLSEQFSPQIAVNFDTLKGSLEEIIHGKRISQPSTSVFSAVQQFEAIVPYLEYIQDAAGKQAVVTMLLPLLEDPANDLSPAARAKYSAALLTIVGDAHPFAERLRNAGGAVDAVVHAPAAEGPTTSKPPVDVSGLGVVDSNIPENHVPQTPSHAPAAPVDHTHKVFKGVGVAMAARGFQDIEERKKRGEQVSALDEASVYANAGQSTLEAAGKNLDDFAAKNLAKIAPKLERAGSPLVQALFAIPSITSAYKSGDTTAIGSAVWGSVGGIGGGMAVGLATQAVIPIPVVGFVVGVIAGDACAKLGGLANTAMFNDDPAQRDAAKKELLDIGKEYLASPGALLNLPGAAIASVGRSVAAIGQAAQYGAQKLDEATAWSKQKVSDNLPPILATPVNKVIGGTNMLVGGVLHYTGKGVEAIGNGIDSAGAACEKVGHAVNASCAKLWNSVMPSWLGGGDVAPAPQQTTPTPANVIAQQQPAQAAAIDPQLAAQLAQLMPSLAHQPWYEATGKGDMNLTSEQLKLRLQAQGVALNAADAHPTLSAASMAAPAMKAKTENHLRN